jgi:hypothetical protein
MVIIPEYELIEKCQIKNSWDLGNKVLYDLCKRNFNHDTDEKILAKVWLIGRSYSAAIERRKNKSKFSEINDNFYTDKVAPCIKKSEIDAQLKFLKTTKQQLSNIPIILKTHCYLSCTIYEITEMEKRSFCSKYLHFHLPNHYYIYDSRAVNAIRHFVNKLPKEINDLITMDNVDKEYAKFYCKCFLLQNKIEKETGIKLTHRQLDNLLIEVANRNLRNYA